MVRSSCNFRPKPVWLNRNSAGGISGRFACCGCKLIITAVFHLSGCRNSASKLTKVNLLALLRQPDRWKTAVIINLQPQQANLPEIPPAELRFSQTGFGLKLQLDLTIAQDLDGALVERELLRAILLEMIYRKEPDIAPDTVFVEPPDWLLDGVLALTPGRDRGP